METIAFDSMLRSLNGIVEKKDDRIIVKDEVRLRAQIDGLVQDSVFGSPEAQASARWLIWEAAQSLGIRPASIQDLYTARGRGEIDRLFTVPALNLRMLAYDSARAVFRAAASLDAGALIFEIARSEMSYSDQRPSEYTSAVLAAAIKEGYRGPVFIQGDHFQAALKKFQAGKEAELKSIRDLIVEAIAGGFYNIDIDTSTLVDLSQPTLDEQQKVNYETSAYFTRFIHEQEPEGLTISIGGEIGEVGHKNSTPEELDAYMAGYRRLTQGLTGISKISLQTGTSHGGVVLPDGTLARVAIDFEVLRTMSDKARREYGLAGGVQHGASTLPDSAFHKFAESGACEVHLATGFMTLIMDHEMTPESLRQQMNDWLRANASDERKATDTEAQFLYKTRKKAIGPFKKHFWSLPGDAREAIGASLEKQFHFLFEQLKISGTAEMVARYVRPAEIRRPLMAGAPAGKKESVEGLSD